MTRQEAIEALIKKAYAFHGEEVKVLAMAIEALQQEQKQRHWVDTPEEFAKKMSRIAESVDAEADHVKADELMCQLLTSLGYGEGVKIFRDMYKWYS